MEIRLQKFIANAGLCSRRKAEELIIEGRVKVNKKIVTIGTKVTEEDEILVDNKAIELKKDDKVYIKINKPVGYTCTNREFKGEKNIFNLIKSKKRLFCIGRLDKDSRGLVLLTNDGELTQKLTHPKYQHRKIYIVKVYENKQDLLTMDKVKNVEKACKAGIDSEEGLMKAKEVKYLGSGNFKITLTEGKKRQIRKMFGSLDLRIKDLKRVGVDDLKLDELKESDWKYLSKEEVKNLQK